MKLQGRRILVTGGASGIGRATAEACLREGAQVAIIDIDAAAMEGMAVPGRRWTFHGDVRDEQGLAAAVAAAAAAMHGLDGLVHCAGVANGTPFEETDFDTWKTQIETNLGGTFLACKAAMPFLRQADAATIVNIASAQALLPTGSSSSYTAAKGGVVAFSKTIAIELAPKIRVNVVCPGTTRTPMVDGVLKTRPDAISRNLASVPMGRIAEAPEVADLIVYLTSRESSFVTGTAIAVDGGRTRH
ncbi:MAG: 3-oxoacyl-ACP reductase [Ramlibacter sp.]|nr:3-oxoacyl-ACP reductase [Ramlibacter sp.]